MKEAIDYALLLRGHRNFDDRAAYEIFVREAVMRRNQRHAAAFRIEREQLQDLPDDAPPTSSNKRHASRAAAPSPCAPSCTARPRA